MQFCTYLYSYARKLVVTAVFMFCWCLPRIHKFLLVFTRKKLHQFPLQSYTGPSFEIEHSFLCQKMLNPVSYGCRNYTVSLPHIYVIHWSSFLQVEVGGNTRCPSLGHFRLLIMINNFLHWNENTFIILKRLTEKESLKYLLYKKMEFCRQIILCKPMFYNKRINHSRNFSNILIFILAIYCVNFSLCYNFSDHNLFFGGAGFM